MLHKQKLEVCNQVFTHRRLQTAIVVVIGCLNTNLRPNFVLYKLRQSRFVFILLMY